jgi:CheY-like chemotaxis protein
VGTEKNTNPLHVLLVEDDERILELRSKMFERRGCVVVEASSLDDALQELKQSPAFELVIVDINLGTSPDDRSGIELARIVREQQPSVPIVGYSAYFSADELADDEASPFDRTVAKGSVHVDDLGEFTDWMVKLARERGPADGT